jgi:hypothetical protein
MTVDAIKEAIQHLPEQERWKLAGWFDAMEETAWDEEMKRDFAPGGRGEKLASQIISKPRNFGQEAPIEKGPSLLGSIDSRPTFDNFLDHLAMEGRRAGDHWHLWGAIEGAFDNYERELSQTPQFWKLTRRALKDSVVLRLGRLFDPNKQALSLFTFLNAIQHHAANHTLGSLELDVPGLDAAAVREELNNVSKDDPLIARLIQVRNEYLAHRQGSLVRRESFDSLPTLSRDDLETLAQRASTILDKYCRLYERPLPSVRFVGADDYKHLFALLKIGLEHV